MLARRNLEFLNERMSAFAVLGPKPDEVDGSRSRHLGAKMGCRQANPSKGAIRHGY